MKHNFQQIWETIAENIKQDIIKGKLKSSQRLKISELSQKYGVSNTPIREAFHYLANLGFVENIPRRMVLVKKITTREIEDLYPIQSVLEGLSAGLTSRLLGQKELAKFENIFQSLEDHARSGNVDLYSKMDLELHETLIQYCGNEKLKQYVNNARDHIARFRFISLHYPGRLEKSMKEHRGVWEALRSRNHEAVEEKMKSHIRISGELLKRIAQESAPDSSFRSAESG